MNNKTKKWLVAVGAGVAVLGASGCATTYSADMARTQAQAAPVAEAQVMRPLQSYGTMGGYRYRRFASAAAS